MTLHIFFEYLIYISLAFFALCYLPTQLMSYLRRRKRKKSRLKCRLCAYRFLKNDAAGTCPHCGAVNTATKKAP